MRTNKEKIATVVSLLSAASAAVSLGREAYSKYRDNFTYTASIQSDTFVFDKVMEWLNVETQTKNVQLHSSQFSGISTLYSSSSTAKVRIDGHTLYVNLEDAAPTPDGYNPNQAVRAQKLVFWCRTAAGIDALRNKMEELVVAKKRDGRKLQVYSYSSYGWNGSDMLFRDIDAVVMADGKKETVINDIETFLDNESHYARIGIPWHRGYMFYGPPGNGKTSLALALANKFKMSLYNLPLSGVTDDKQLADAISDISPNSILLLEDIDVFSKAIGREQADSGPTLAGLLNALDGVATPHGLLTIMTSNFPDVLDSALTRPGRIDLRVEFNRPTPVQIKTAFCNVYGETLDTEPRHFESMAELSNIFKVHMNDAESARLEIKGLTLAAVSVRL